MAGVLRINRDILAKFLPDHETIRQFEELFTTVYESSSNDAALIQSESATAKANLAIALINDLKEETFERVNQNIKSYNKALSYTGLVLNTVAYTFGTKTITKTLGYSGINLVTVTLSGDTPGGINLIKTLTYSGLNLTGVAYT